MAMSRAMMLMTTRSSMSEKARADWTSRMEWVVAGRNVLLGMAASLGFGRLLVLGSPGERG